MNAVWESVGVCDLKSLATHLDSYNLSTPSITGICSSICIYIYI